MSDMLAGVDDLNLLLEEDVPRFKAELLINLATGAVQAATGQRLVQVTGDVVELTGTTDSWLPLPERPVTAVTLVKVDGSPVTDYLKRGSRLWRECGWSDNTYRPSLVEVTYTHGYPTGHSKLGLARSTALMLAAQAHENPQAATGFAVDDYRENFSQMAESLAGQLPASVVKALRRAYGRQAGLVRIG